MSKGTLTRHDLEAKIVKRCWEDEAFRREFIANPVAAFSKYLELPPPSLPKVVVHEELPGLWHIVLPQRPAEPDKLSEQDLEAVAGGATPIPGLIIATFVASAAGSAIVGSASASVSITLDKGW
jgi:hypothetical protein